MRKLKIGKKTFRWGERTYIIGILNVTPDSFSDGGKYLSPDVAVGRALQMQAEGADIIDIGGESSRPGAEPVSAEEEMKRVIPVIEEVCDKLDIPISIDTYKSKVAEKAIEFGVSIVNDISALRFDPDMAKVVAEHDVPIVLMHMKGTPRDMQLDPDYNDVMHEIVSFLNERKEFAISSGIDEHKIILDPGIGFGKRTGEGIEDNCEILKRLKELKTLNQPILVGASRKRFIGNVCGDGKQLPVTERLEGSLAAIAVAVMNGADIVRVHDVKESKRFLRLFDMVVRQ